MTSSKINNEPCLSHSSLNFDKYLKTLTSKERGEFMKGGFSLNSKPTINYEFDTTKPNGFPKRVMDISLAKKMINYNPSTSLLSGLKETWDWFKLNEKEYLSKKNYFTD